MRFPVTLLDGAQLDRNEFLPTPLGQLLDDFFVGGPGAEEDFIYRGAEGFSVVSDSLVLGYQDDVPTFNFEFDGNRVVGWGTCGLLIWASGDLSAYRWHVLAPVSADSTGITLAVEGEACPIPAGQALTDIVDIEVVEDSDSVEILVWARPPEVSCFGGSGAEVYAVVGLDRPLGHRTLLDGGVIPALVVQP